MQGKMNHALLTIMQVREAIDDLLTKRAKTLKGGAR